jgi:hypothetical protein
VRLVLDHQAKFRFKPQLVQDRRALFRDDSRHVESPVGFFVDCMA